LKNFNQLRSFHSAKSSTSINKKIIKGPSRALSHDKNYFFTVVLLTFVPFDAVTLDAVRLEVVLFVAERFVTGVLTVAFCADAFTVTGLVISAGAEVVVTTWVVGTGVATGVETVVVGVVAGGVEVQPAVIMTTAMTKTSNNEDTLIQLM